jgi:hypothetical protein
VFEITDYEPDPVTAYTLAAGGIASFGDYLYWSTLHLPGSGLAAFVQAYGAPANNVEYVLAFFNTYRPTIVFRGKDFGTEKQVVELLYGDLALPVYTGERWTLMPNNMGAAPLYGAAGFGNYFNAYTWSMQVYKGKLYAGTFDWSYLAGLGLAQFEPLPLPLPGASYGADLFRFDSTKKAATPIGVYGVGNYLNYGIRNMLVANGVLYVGSANPMNLETAAGEPNGGWELIELSK